jgi:predicted alpha/beta superfamily hydrolase
MINLNYVLTFLRAKKVLFIVMVTCIQVSSLHAQYAKVEEYTIESRELNQTREIMVYTPLGYDEYVYTYYNVIYVFDAQTRELFDYVSSLANLSRESGQGIIVVGIKATDIIEIKEGKKNYVYFRNLDLLPEDTDFFRDRYQGNSSAFLAYIKNEVIPYVEENYRVLPGKMAVGHSLSASFLMASLAKVPDLFDSYVAISPNLDYDDYRIIKDLRHFNTRQFKSPKYLYVSHGNEGEAFGWDVEPGQKFIKDSLSSEYLKVTVENFPEQGHMSNFIGSMGSVMRTYFDSIRPLWNETMSVEKYQITLRLKVLDEEDEIYVSGNQSGLGSWDPDKIKMDKVAPLIRELKVEVHDHAEIKFFRDGNSQAWIKFGEEGRSTYPIMIRPIAGSVYNFEVYKYN